MKKLLSLMLAFIMIFALVSCDLGKDDDDDDEGGSGSKTTTESLQKNAEDMGYVCNGNPTDPDLLAEFNEEMYEELAEIKEDLEYMTDEDIIDEVGEEMLAEIKALKTSELKGQLTYFGEFNNPTENFHYVLIYGFEQASDAKIMKTLLTLDGGYNDGDFVVLKDKFIVVSFSEDVANAVINGAKKVESVNGMGAEELYQTEYNKISNAQSITCYTTQDIVIRLSELGAGYDETMEQSNRTIFVGDDQYGYLDSDANGNQEYWYVDGIYYCIANGQKIKGEIDLDAYAQKLGLQDAKQGLINVPADWFKGVEIKSVNGTYFMIMTVKGEKYTEMVGNAIGDMYESQGISVQISDVAYKVYLNEEGHIDNIVADYQLYLSIQGQKVTADIYQRTDVSDLNSSVIPSIENPDSFYTVDLESALGMK